MNKLITELHHVHAANEPDYSPDWLADIPDDWSETIQISSELPVVNSRYNENGELLTSSVNHSAKKSNETESSELDIAKAA